MATYIPKILQKIIKYKPTVRHLDIVEKAGRVIGPGGAMIFASRAIGAARGKYTSRSGGKRKSLKDRLTPYSDTEYPGTSSEWTLMKEIQKTGYQGARTPLIDYSNVEFPAPLYERYKNEISIINLDAGDEPGDSAYKTLVLTSVPKKLSYDSGSNFVGLASIGRNNPHYNFAGSEDTLTFSIDWYCKYKDRAEVLNNCRWVEALTKSNGYQSRPPRVMIQWGKENHLFGNDQWIVVKADYELSNFQNAYNLTDFQKNKNFSPVSRVDDIQEIGNLPQQAYQNITLKRITNNNRTWAEVRKIEGLENNRKIVK